MIKVDIAHYANQEYEMPKKDPQICNGIQHRGDRSRMIKVDIAKSFEHYTNEEYSSVCLPYMPKKGDKLILGEASFERVKEEGNPRNLFNVEGVYLIEGYYNPLIIVSQDA